MAKAELKQICWTTLLKDFCNNTSVFLLQHFIISTTSFCIFATRSIYTEAQRHSFDPKNLTWPTRGPNRPLEWESAHFSWPTQGHNWPSWHRMEWESAHFSWHPRGHNWPFRCLDYVLSNHNNFGQEGGRAGINKNVTDTKCDRRGVTTDPGRGGRAGISKNVTDTFR